MPTHFMHYILSGFILSQLIATFSFAENNTARAAYLQGDYIVAYQEWLISAKRARDAEAQFNLGYLFENGQGVTRDLFAAVKWYELAARQNYPTASTMLASARHKIRKENQKKLLQWLPKAEAGDSDSQLAVSKILAVGENTIQDEIEALKWLILAIENTTNKSTLNRMSRFKKQLEQRLSKDQRQKAEARVALWKDLRKPIN